jgi:hypothetical protein
MSISNKYQFVSRWHIAAPVTVVEQALLKTKDWQKWWDGLEEIKTTHDEVGQGAEYDCTWRSSMGYKLRFHIVITKYTHDKEIAFTASGDLLGGGEFRMRKSDNKSTDITIKWNVATTKKWMRLFGPFLRPLFIINHDKLMREGETGLANYVAKSHN